jgi:hypothetical protein
MKITHGSAPSRRSFLKASLAAAAAGCLLRPTRAFADVSGITFGVQLYMLRRQAQTDLAGVFRTIHDAGFPQVELYPIAYSHSAAEIRRMMQDAGIAAIAGHSTTWDSKTNLTSPISLASPTLSVL